MSLFSRIAHIPPDEERGIANHAFEALLHEYARGEATRQDFIDSFSLTGTEPAGLDALLARIDARNTTVLKLIVSAALKDVCMLSEHRIKYLTEANFSSRLSRA